MSTANSNAPAQPNGSAKGGALDSVSALGDNPLALLAGGVALGVLIGAVLPRAAKERELLDPLGRNLAQRATAAAQAARDAGRQEIDSLLPNKDDTKERVTTLFGNILDAAKDAAQKA